ncbi:MAG TPA: Clp protease N-terminal domain-containing protein [Pyrinomonadaceae bacterium]|nr:Clp protease N-terminal domain-containing protein [Pyrinomonadaceae bacterium]
MSSLEKYRPRFDEGGWRVFRRVIEESCRQGQYQIFSEHIIKGLFAEDQDLFEDILKKLGVELEAFQRTMEKLMQSRPQHSEAKIILAVEVIEMLKRALGRARSQGRLKISKTDMLISLAQDELGTLLKIFGVMGVEPLTVVNVIRVTVEVEQSQQPSPIEQEVEQFCRKGDTIRITTGAFAAMSAKVAEVDYERSVLKVNVSIYGRSNLIELSFSDVEKVSFD